MKRRLYRPILVCTLVVLGLVSAFQACTAAKKDATSSGSETKKIELQNNSGNGSGYGGKLQPGRYYALTPQASCPSQPNSKVDAIVHVREDNRVIYYDSCQESGGQEIQASDLTVVEANSSVIGLKAAGLNFERFDQVPIALPDSKFVEAVCYLYPGIPYFEIQVLIRRPLASTPTTHVTEVYFSRLQTDLSQGIHYGSVTPFTSQFDGSDPLRSRYVKTTNPKFDLTIQANGYSSANPTPTGRFRGEIEGKEYDFQAELCLFNRGPR